MSTTADLREDLMENDDEFRRLYEAHQSHERRLQELTEHPSPSIDGEIKGLKVQKLHLKDRMEAILREHQ